MWGLWNGRHTANLSRRRSLSEADIALGPSRLFKMVPVGPGAFLPDICLAAHRCQRT